MATRAALLDAVASRLPLTEDDFAMTETEKQRVRTKEVVKNVLANEFGLSSRTDQIALAMNIKGGYVKDPKTLQDLKRKIELENILKLDEEDFETSLTGQTYYVDTDKGKVKVVSPDTLRIIDSKNRPLADNDGYLTQRHEIPFVPGLWNCMVVPLPKLEFWKKDVPKKSGLTPCWELVSITDYGCKSNNHAQIDCQVLVIGPNKLALADRVHARSQQEYMYESVTKSGVPVHKLDFKPNVLIWDAMKSDKYKNVRYDPIKDTGFNVYKPATGVYYRELIKMKPRFGEELNNEGQTTLSTSKGNSFSVTDNDLGRGIQFPFEYMCIWTAKYSESERFPKPQVEIRDMDFQFVVSYREEVKIDVDDALTLWSDEIYQENAPRMESSVWMGPNFVQPSKLKKVIDLINPIEVVHRDDPTASQLHIERHEDHDDVGSEYSTESRLDFTIRTKAYNPIEEHRTDLISHHRTHTPPPTSSSSDVNIFEALPSTGVDEAFLKRKPREIENLHDYTLESIGHDTSKVPSEWTNTPNWINTHKISFKAYYERQTGQNIDKSIFMTDPVDIEEVTNFDQVLHRLTECIRGQLQFVHEELNIISRLVKARFLNKGDTLTQNRVEGESMVLHERCKNFVLSRLCQAEHLLSYATDGVDSSKFNNTVTVTVDSKEINVLPQASLLLRGGFGNCDLGDTMSGIVRDLSVWIEYHAHYLTTKVVTLPSYKELIKNEWEGAGVNRAIEDGYHPGKGTPAETLFASTTLNELDKLLSFTAVLTAAANLSIVNAYLKHYGVGDESLRLHAKPYEVITECTAQMKYFAIYFRFLYNHELFSLYGESLADSHDYPMVDEHSSDYQFWPGGYLLTPATFTVIDDKEMAVGSTGKEDNIIPAGNGSTCQYYKGIELVFPRYRHPLSKTDVGSQLIQIDDIFHGHSTMLNLFEAQCHLAWEGGLAKVFTKDISPTVNIPDFTVAKQYSKGANFLTDLAEDGSLQLHTYLADRIESIGLSVQVTPTSSMYGPQNPDDEKYLFDFGTYVRITNASWLNGFPRSKQYKYSDFFNTASTGAIQNTTGYEPDKEFFLKAENYSVMPVACSPFNWFFGEAISTDHMDFPNFPRYTRVEFLKGLFDRMIAPDNSKVYVDSIKSILDFGLIREERESDKARLGLWNVPREPLRLWMMGSFDLSTNNKMSIVNTISTIVPITNKVRQTDLSVTKDFSDLKHCPFFDAIVGQYWEESVKFTYKE